jgi:hypothetical protein
MQQKRKLFYTTVEAGRSTRIVRDFKQGCCGASPMRPGSKIHTSLFLFLASCLVALGTAHAQVVLLPERGAIDLSGDDRSATPTPNPREETAAPSSLKDVLPIHVQDRNDKGSEVAGRTIIIGFVGGFVKKDDPRHPEVHFAEYLRDRYPSSVYAEVFSNHEGQKALRQVLRLLDTDHDGDLSSSEKQQARIIIYGHSWGASETVSLARKLGENGIPVLLTIQMDTIAKPGQNGSTISPNVANAVNFYQSRGPLHGRSEILAADPVRTKIIGNFQMTYQGYHVNCDNYSWYARFFNKPHHQIENDPRVWDQAGSLIDSQLSNPASAAQASSPSKSPLFNLIYARQH